MGRIHSIDVLKLVIAAGVVWAHATLMIQDIGVLDYILGLGLARTVVPTFAVVSGFLFYSTLHHGRARAWLIRLGAFYLFWLVLYVPVWWPDAPTLGNVVPDVVFGPIHLWYMAALMMALMLLHGVMLLAGKDERRGRRWLMGLGLVFLLCGSAFQLIDFFTDKAQSMHLWRNGVFFAFPFVVVGYLVADRIQRRGMDWLPGAGQAWTLLGLFVLLRLAEAGLSLYMYGLSKALPEFPLLLVAFALSLLLVVLRTHVPRPPVNIAFLSMMIYFLHFIVLLGAIRFGVTGIWALVLLGVGLPMLAGGALLALGRWLQGRSPSAWHRRLYGSAGLRDSRASASAWGQVASKQE
jgi:surface polysaccharide O-acyltransferase-like enzyme